MGDPFISFDLREIPPREAYGLLTAFVQPRPIAFVSTIGSNGVLNLAPFSFFMAGGSNPPSVCYSPTLNSRGGEKDSLRNARDTGEFVVNTVHRPMAVEMNKTSATLSAEESEWDVAGFTPVASELVAPPRVAESLAQFECRVFKIIEHGDGPSAARYVIGEVLRIHFLADLLRDGRLDTDRIETVARMGGPEYLDTAALEIFALDRPG